MKDKGNGKTMNVINHLLLSAPCTSGELGKAMDSAGSIHGNISSDLCDLCKAGVVVRSRNERGQYVYSVPEEVKSMPDAAAHVWQAFRAKRNRFNRSAAVRSGSTIASAGA